MLRVAPLCLLMTACATSTSRSDAGPMDAAIGRDAGTPSDAGFDAAFDAGFDAGDAGPCPPGECRIDGRGPCAPPGGTFGNGCCECTGDVCTSVCVCLAGDTRIATPTGEVPVRELAPGDLVYSVHEGAFIVAPIVRMRRSPVSGHSVLRVHLASGAVLRASPLHPTADGSRLDALRPGDALGDTTVLAVEVEPYDAPFTYDVRPATDTGAYVAEGVLLGSTLR